MTKIAMMQPTFLPWLGLFEQIYNCDKFIFLDDFQFSIQSHHTRNKLFVGKNQIDYYAVPIQKTKCFECKLNETLIVKNIFWKNKILKRFKNVYAKSEYFKIIYPKVENWLTQNYKILSNLNIEGIKMFCKILNIEKEFLYSSNFTRETQSKSIRSEKVVDILNWSNATEYICAFGAYDYMAKDKIFPIKNIKVSFQNFNPKPYKQIHSNEFIPFLSILDALFNVGPINTLDLIKNGTDKWLTVLERENYEK